MLTVTDVYGEQWTVRRRWWYDMTHVTESLGGTEALGGPLLLAVAWPIWFVAHWFGLRWRIAVYRDGTLSYEKVVRGWGASRRRMRRIADDISAGVAAA
ncbi:hypothetical protein [Mycolicibacterium arenosum]|uniref:Uncharacterized protein n=1 Tax=Mycolicibacterium arenosum TaxID=2952157 RepID=A0ABT1M782_9MYCO|nr:hypothetical protein [Mycolicibacterium sp. CAU 1645]MCP9275026.1 hypothetical protein [Mycolicibacterium sp. CAU 1645]